MNRGFQLPAGCSNLSDRVSLIGSTGRLLGEMSLYEASRLARLEKGGLFRIDGNTPRPTFRIVHVLRLKPGKPAAN